MDMCSVMALGKDKSGVVRLDKKNCVGCLICVGECLRDYMFYHDDLPVPFKCTACGLCVKECPGGALAIEEADRER
jgi:Fe-S-cluster-containing dehydrogenase component